MAGQNTEDQVSVDDRTDEDWARMVADKVAKHPKLHEELAKKVLASMDDAQSFENERKRKNSMEEFHGQLPSVEVTPGEPVINKRDSTDDAGQTLEEVTAKTAAGGAARGAAEATKPAREGVIYFQNTTNEGKKERGQMVSRKMFKNDAEFDKFANHAREKGLLWDESAPESGGGGTLGSRLKKAAAALIGNAAPSGAEGGGGTDVRVVDVPRDYQGATMGQNGDEPNSGSNDGSSAVTRVGPDVGVTMPHGQYTEKLAMKNPNAGWESTLQSGKDLSDNIAETSRGILNSVPGPFANNFDKNVRTMGQQFPESPDAMPPDPAGGPQPDQNTTDITAPQIGVSMPNRPMPDAPPDFSSEIAKNADELAKANAAHLEAQAKAWEAHGNAATQRENDLIKAQTRVQKMQETQDHAFQQVQQTFDETSKLLNSPAQTPDPERYWNDHSKIMFAIGIGLLAQSGNGELAKGLLSSTSAAIDRDVEAQKRRFDAPREAAKERRSSAMQLYGMFRERGHDAFESEKLSQAIMSERYANTVDKITAASNAASVRAQGPMMAAQFREKALQAMQAASQHAGTLAVSRFTAQEGADYHRGELSLKAQEFNAKAKNDKAMSDKDAKSLAVTSSDIDQMTKAGEVFKANPFINKLSSLWPTGTTDAGQWERQRPLFTRSLMGLLSPTERANEKMRENVESMIPHAGDVDGPAKWKLITSFLQERNGRVIGTAEAHGRTAQIKAATTEGRVHGTKDGKPGWYDSKTKQFTPD